MAMERKKFFHVCWLVAACILLNFIGRRIADILQPPLWLDSFGTAISAYILGPVCGSIVGLTSNLIFGILDNTALAYGLANVAIGITIGIAGQRKQFETAFGAMSAGIITTFACVVISVPLNFYYFEGWSGNLWGNGVSGYLREQGFSRFISMLLGEFYVDFLDKLALTVVIYIVVKVLRHRRTMTEKASAHMLVLFVLIPALMFGISRPAEAAEKNGSVPGAPTVETVKSSSDDIESPYEASLSEEEMPDYDDYVQTIYSANNGLPCGEANDIVQTNDGILWIGTYAGLYRYNGSAFRWLDQFESVRNVNALYVDEEGRLWIGTNDNGLSIIINESIVNVVDMEGGLPSNSVRCITQGYDGYYYIGTTSSLQVLTLNSGLQRVNTVTEIEYADCITADHTGYVAAVNKNRDLFLLKNGELKNRLSLPTGEEGFVSCTFSPEDLLYVGTSTNHVYIYSIENEEFVQQEIRECRDVSNIKDIYFLDNGEIFLCADNGVGYFNVLDEFKLINTNQFSNSIDNMLVDYQGNLWFTSSRLGLLRLARSAFRDVYSTIGMESRVVNAVERWQDTYYIGTDNGLDVIDRSLRHQLHNSLAEELEGVRIRCLRADAKGNLWICTYGKGLYEVHPDGTEKVYDTSNGGFARARVVEELSDGTIAAGGDSGLLFIKDDEVIRKLQREDGLLNPMILTITEMPDGRILAGMDGEGIAVVKDLEISHLITRKSKDSETDGLSSGVILRTIYNPSDGGVFIVTSNGLCYMDADENVRRLDKFPYFNNYDIWMDDEGTMFVMSSAGIFILNAEDLLYGEGDLNYEFLDARQGLSSSLTANSWTYCDENGDLFLPCDAGVFVINTEKRTLAKRSYRMMVSSVKLDNINHRVEKGLPIRIGRGISRIEIFPEVLNYSIEDPLAGYYLEGFDPDWTILPQSDLYSIVYTNLPTGNYTFHLAVFDRKGNFLEERNYSIIKEKELFDNHWFIVYMLLVAGLAIVCFTWYIARTQIQRTLNFKNQELKLARQQAQMGNETIIAIAKAVDAKDESTSQHSYRVSKYAVMIAREMGFSEKECKNLERAARMHDIGKIGIPDRILNKPGRLTDEEYGIMKSHVTKGAEILKDVTLIEHVVEGARYHHERYDGRGYPEGLKGENIPLYGRIIGVADAFDAMTANRIYRHKLDFDYVLGELHRGRGTQFDPEIVDIFLRIIEDGTLDIDSLYADQREAAAAREAVERDKALAGLSSEEIARARAEAQAKEKAETEVKKAEAEAEAKKAETQTEETAETETKRAEAKAGEASETETKTTEAKAGETAETGTPKAEDKGKADASEDTEGTDHEE